MHVQRLQDELGQAQGKLQVLNDKHVELEEHARVLHQQVEQEMARADHAEAARDAARGVESELNAQCKQLQETVQEQEAMIGWLNKQVNAAHLGGGVVRAPLVERVRVHDSSPAAVPALRSKVGRMLAGQSLE